MPPRSHIDGGSTTVEFALAFPVLVLIMFGIIDGGRFIGARVMLSNAASVGVRTACLSSSTSQTPVNDAVRDAAIMLSGTAVNIECAGANCGAWPKPAGSFLVFRVQYEFTAGFFTGFSKTMTQHSRMVCQ
jgi:Flp pilus assembly protein TadG